MKSNWVFNLNLYFQILEESQVDLKALDTSEMTKVKKVIQHFWHYSDTPFQVSILPGPLGHAGLDVDQVDLREEEECQEMKKMRRDAPAHWWLLSSAAPSALITACSCLRRPAPGGGLQSYQCSFIYLYLFENILARVSLCSVIPRTRSSWTPRPWTRPRRPSGCPHGPSAPRSARARRRRPWCRHMKV